jgi:hypothetical protein
MFILNFTCSLFQDLILWDSRTIHCNTPGVDFTDDKVPVQKGQRDYGSATIETFPCEAIDNSASWSWSNTAQTLSAENAAQLLRVVSYVCMLPKATADEETIRLRQRAYRLGVGSTHWPTPFCPLEDLKPMISAHTPKEEQAIVLARKAGEWEDKGEHTKAAQCWRRAFKLFPALETTLYEGIGGEETGEVKCDDTWLYQQLPLRRSLIGENLED